MISHIRVEYQSQVNGCNLTDVTTGEELMKWGPSIDLRAEEVADAVCDYGINYVDDDGEFYGDIDDVESIARRAVALHFGPEVIVTFVEDAQTN